MSIELADGFWDCPVEQQEDFFQIRLLMLLQDNGRYGLHANGVVRGRAGCLLVGPSGSGKTTLALALLRSGWQSIGDDVAVLNERREEIVARGLRRRARCGRATLDAFPEVRVVLDPAAIGRRGKHDVDIERSFPGSFARECRPQRLLFPERTDAASSRLLPLEPTAALTRLIAQSVGWDAHRATAARHLDVLRRLVVQTECYRFLGGADVLERAESVADLLAREKLAC